MLTFRLADSLPKERLDAWCEELARLPVKEAAAERRRRIEAYLDRGDGQAWLGDHHIATIVQESLLFFDGERYRLHAWVIMPNHVHVLFTPMNTGSLADILHSWKSYTTHKANRILNCQGKFWQEESFDRYIRDERHFLMAMNYIESNPVKARLCAKNKDWEFSSASREHAGETPALPGR